jgi:hypothetical protein
MKLVPFTIHIRIVPDRPGKRWEYIRAMQKIAVFAYDAIINVSGVHSATPGGGQNLSIGDINRRGALGGFANGTAVKPQIGQSPAQLMLTGFYESTAANVQPYSDQSRISGGEWYSGPGKHTNDAMPSSTFDSEVKSLKLGVEAALTANLPNGTEYNVYRIDYAGLIYGDRGFHFPR